ncbi:L30e-like protein [Cylindrobasidium torrendii FP15055 ss-10]|uniref:H/ACA ribonucleoprotein complex subunit 2 n=1 Tax=Cylindrobasidium torrendii FP15055 ss-10 TaxID=1314674 RepID=A0A0D7BLU3_9AGAR|nr:L30e-like protein [Cylindrobasidium torrendii FP15055 ss-10]
MAGDKSEKKKRRESKIEAPTEDVEMGDAEAPKAEKAEVIIPAEDLSPLAHPLAQKKLLKKLQKATKKASKGRMVKRGVKEVVKGIKKGEKGLLIIAGDISPIDIVSHLPVLAEDAEIPYIFIPSKEELGHYSATKRPTSCIMICPTQKRKKVEKDEDEAEFLELYKECLAEVKKLDTQIVF